MSATFGKVYKPSANERFVTPSWKAKEKLLAEEKQKPCDKK